MSVIIYFGDNDTTIANRAKMHDSNAYLIDCNNYKNFYLSRPQNCVCYTSLSDLPKDLSVVVSILSTADTIIYSPPETWSDQKKISLNNITNCIQGLTETILLHLSNFKKVINIDLCIEQKYNNILADERKTDSKQLWIAGCSVSHGVGVDLHERYGSLLSQELNLPCSFLTFSGSSIQWAANQILKSDLRSGDILCWGITNFSRIPFYYQNKLQHILAVYYELNKNFNKIFPIELLTNENTLFQNLESIRAVTNFCEKLKIQLIMFNALTDNQLNRVLRKEKYYYQFPYSLNKNFKTYEPYGLFVFDDLGNDNHHPGPITHQKYYKFLSQIIDTKSIPN